MTAIEFSANSLDNVIGHFSWTCSRLYPLTNDVKPRNELTSMPVDGSFLRIHYTRTIWFC